MKTLPVRFSGLMGAPFWVMAILLVAIPAMAQEKDQYQINPREEVLATARAMEGKPTIQRAGEAKFNLIKKNTPMYRGDFVATTKKTKLWWQGEFSAYTPTGDWKPLPEMTHGSLAADSVFGFLEFQRRGPSYRFIGQVPKGSVRFIKKMPLTDPPSSFILATPTGWIEVLNTDRAADFVVQSVNNALTTVTVIWGRVKVKNISPDFTETRILSSCQEVDVERDKEPGKVRWVSSDTLKKLIKRTTIPDTLPEDVPSCERVKTEVALQPGEIFIPPPGVLLFPVPIPIPGNGDDGEECPCPCPEGEQFVEQTGECFPCRRGAEYNPETCACECPCPEGQILLPGQGCVPDCPEGYSVNWDVSNYPPYRCPYCTQQPTPPPPPRSIDCDEDTQCPECYECYKGNCVTKRCGQGQYLNPDTCECDRISVTFGPPVVSTPPEDVDECGPNNECPKGQRCRNGKCVDRRPRKPPQQTSSEVPDVKFDDPFFKEPKREKPKSPFSIQGGFSIGIGAGPGGGGPRRPPGPTRDTPQSTPGRLNR